MCTAVNIKPCSSELLVKPKQHILILQSNKSATEFFLFLYMNTACFSQTPILNVARRARASLLGFIPAIFSPMGKPLFQSKKKKEHLILLSDLFTWLMGAQGPLLSLCRAWQSFAVLWREFGWKRGTISPFDIREAFILDLMTLCQLT